MSANRCEQCGGTGEERVSLIGGQTAVVKCRARCYRSPEESQSPEPPKREDAND